MISPIVVCCLRILNCFFRSSLPQENPPSEWRKKSWWAVHKHHGCYVNTHVNMYINPCHPMCTHQAAIGANIKGGEPAAEPGRTRICVPCLFCVLGCGFCLSSYYWCLCLRQTGSDGPAPGGVQGDRVGPNWLPLAVKDWRFTERPPKSRKK